MPLTSLTCPICLAVLKPSQPVAEGARVRCPKCKGAFVAEGEPRIEEAAPEAVQEPILDAVEDGAAEEDVIAAPPPRKKPDRAPDEEPDRPRKRAQIRDDEHDE